MSDQFNFGALGKAKKIMLKLHSKMDKMDKIKSASSWWQLVAWVSVNGGAPENTNTSEMVE